MLRFMKEESLFLEKNVLGPYCIQKYELHKVASKYILKKKVKTLQTFVFPVMASHV